MFREIRDNIAKISLKSQGLILLAVFLVALFLRLYGINFGLSGDHKFYFQPDEKYFLVTPVIHMAETGDFNPHFFTYPSFYIYIQAFLYWAFSFLRKAGTDFYLIGRAFSALLGSFSCILVYFIGKEVFNKKIALLSACILAVMPLHAQASHYITTDVPAAFLILLSVFLFLKYMRQERLSYFYLSAIFAGLAISTKYSFIIIFSLILAYVLKNKEKKSAVLPLFTALLLVVLFFFIGTPFSLIERAQFLGNLRSQTRSIYFGFGNGGSNNINGESSFIWYLKYLFTTGTSFPICFTAIFGLITILCKLDIIKTALLYFPILYFIQVSFMFTRYDRYLVPFAPFMAIFSAVGFFEILKFVKIKFYNNRFYKFIVFSLFTLLLGGAFLRTIVFDFYTAGKDTRIEAAEWVRDNLKDKGKILVVSEKDIASLLEGLDASTINKLDRPFYIYRAQGYKYMVVNRLYYNTAENYKNSSLFMANYAYYSDLFNNAQCLKTIKRSFMSRIFSYSSRLESSSSISGYIHNPEIKIFELPSLDELKKRNYIFKAIYYPYDINKNAYSSAQLVKDRGAISGEALKNGWVYGPNDFYPAGKYEVRFGLKFIDNSISDIIAVLDIASGGAGQKVFTRKEIRGTDFKFSKVYQDFVLDLDLPDDSSLQFRVFYPGVRDLWVEKIVVQPIL